METEASACRSLPLSISSLAGATRAPEAPEGTRGLYWNWQHVHLPGQGGAGTGSSTGVGRETGLGLGRFARTREGACASEASGNLKV